MPGLEQPDRGRGQPAPAGIPQPVPECPVKKRKRVVSSEKLLITVVFLLTINLQSQQLWKAKLISMLKDEEEEGRAGRKFRDNTVLESLREHGFEPMTFR